MAQDIKTGRPTKKHAETVTKLLAAFSMGYNVTEACIYADIARETFYRWLKNDPKFSDKIAAAKATLNMRAKEIIVDAIDKGDINAAKWWIEKNGDKGSEPTDHLGELTKLDIEGIKVFERLICLKYRGVLFLEREALINERNPNNDKLIKRKDELLALSDTELADYVQLEVYATHTDKADVKKFLDHRSDTKSRIDEELRTIDLNT